MRASPDRAVAGAITGWLDVVRIFGEPRRYALDEPLRMTIAVAGTVLISYPGEWDAGVQAAVARCLLS